MNIKFSVELFGQTINSSIDIPDYDLESITNDDTEYDFILEEYAEKYIMEFITNKINDEMQIIVDEYDSCDDIDF